MNAAMGLAWAPSHLQSHRCFRAIHTSQPVSWEGMKNVASYYPTGKRRYAAFNNHPYRSSCCDLAVGPVFRLKKQCFRVLSFQDVSKKADSNGREDPEPQTQLPLSSAWQSMNEAEQSSQTMQGFPCWFSNVEKQNLILQANEILQKPIFKLKFLDRDRMMKQFQEQVSQYNLKTWQSLEVTTKFSLAITLLFFLVVTVRYGIQVSGELLPLWIIGPWLISTHIKICMFFIRLCIRIVNSIVQSTLMRVVRGVAVKLLRTKDFLVHAKDSLIQAPWLCRQNFENKRDYIMSGKLKKFLLVKYEEKREEIKENIRVGYMDYMDANWPNWRRTQQFLIKLFPK